ncbi:MAG: hypothetical protein PHX61_02320 [Alphaproteobacteria bacterium]|nr:hypothetical protein [Alphaproteobacteria bacterium]
MSLAGSVTKIIRFKKVIGFVIAISGFLGVLFIPNNFACVIALVLGIALWYIDIDIKKVEQFLKEMNDKEIKL